MATYTVVIERWKPTSTNKLVGGHWAKGHRLKRQDRTVLWVELQRAGVPRATSKRRVSLHVEIGGRGRPPDADNLLKATLDGLVLAGALVDDGPRWCELGTVTVSRGDGTRTTLVLEDVTCPLSPM